MNNLEPVNSRQNNLSPRAKIGDVVMLMFVASPPEEAEVVEVRDIGVSPYVSFMYRCVVDGHLSSFQDKYILKNLTTNVSYE